jgi:hypothetical protein
MNAIARPALAIGRATQIYWWAYPSRLALFVHLPIFVLCALMDETSYALYKHSTKFLSGEIFALGLAAILCFALGAFLLEPRAALAETTRVAEQTVNNALNLLFAIVLAAYAIFLFPVVVSPNLLLDLLQGSTSAMFGLRETLNRIAGLTSLVNLQSLVAVLVCAYRPLTGKRLPQPYRRLMIVLAIACILRAWLWSERLALIELALPVTIVSFAKAATEPRAGLFRPLVFAPPLALVAVFAIFAIGEYFRSWQFYQYVFSGSFLEFAAVRFAGYYATALNTGAAICSLNDPLYMPTETAEWFYRFPLWQLIDERHRPSTFDVMNFLEAYLNPEFNNISGVFMPLLDYGPVLGLACWATLGVLSGYLFRLFALGRVGGLLFFPVWFVGIAELLRVFYWADSRFFVVIVGALVLTRFLTRPIAQPVAGGVVSPPNG